MITLTNGFPQGPNGLIVPNGSITLQLNVDATVIAAPYGFVAADIVVAFQFDGTGRLIQPAKIWSNAELNPQNSVGLGTYYLVTFYDQNGARLNKSPMWWQFPEAANATVDISEMTAYSTIGGNVIYYPTIAALTIPPPGLLTLGGVFANPGMTGAYISAINTDGTVSLTPFSSALVAAGSDTDLQFNTNGVLGGSPNLTFDYVNSTLQVLTTEGNVGIDASCTVTGNTGGLGIRASLDYSGSATVTEPGAAFQTTASVSGNANFPEKLEVINVSLVKGGSGTAALAYGIEIESLIFVGAGTITAYAALFLPDAKDPNSGLSATTNYAILIGDQTGNNPYAIKTGVGVVSFGDVVSAAGPITIGFTHPATSGAINLENNQLIAWRNAANSADLVAGYNGSDVFAVGNMTADAVNVGSILSIGEMQFYGVNQVATVTYATASAANAVGATTTYTGTFVSSGNYVIAGGIVQILGFSNASNNGFFYVVSTVGGTSPTQIVVNNSGGIAESASATTEQWFAYKGITALGAILSAGNGAGSISIGASTYGNSFAAVSSNGEIGLVLARAADSQDITLLDTYLTDQNNRGFQITSVTDGVGSTLYTLRMGLVGGVAGAFFNCLLNAPTLIESATHTPSSATDTGTTGQIAWDASYIYICTATNTWKRVGISTW